MLPKIEFQNSAEETLFTVVSLDNSDKFDAGFTSFGSVPVATPDKQLSEASQHSDDDPAFQPLRAAIEAGIEIEIQMRRPALDQRWRGKVPALNPAMGFINLIAADFHLHCRAIGDYFPRISKIWRTVRLQAFAVGYVRSVVLLTRTKFRDVVPQ